MLIGISGKAGVGKSLCADVGAYTHDAMILPFAKPLKRELLSTLRNLDIPHRVANLYGLPREKSESFTISASKVPDEWYAYGFATICITDIHKAIHQTTYRKLMQWYGTNYRRAQNPDYWVEKFLFEYDDSQLTICDDVRMLNEAEAIKSCDGFLIRVNRPEIKSEDNSQSEIELDNYSGFNLILTNNSTKQDYIKICSEGLEYALACLEKGFCNV